MSIQETSRESFAEEKEKGLSVRQHLVFNVLQEKGPCTDREIADYLGQTDPNFVRPRRFELVKSGAVSWTNKRKCRITGKTSIVWSVSKTPRAQGELF